MKSRQCAICGIDGGCGMLVMGQFICLDCQTLLEDPKKKVFGCSYNRQFAKAGPGKRLELSKVKQ